jgi:flagellar biosynthesis protein FlhG
VDRREPLHSLHDVSRLTGIEESKIRYLENEFSDFFKSKKLDLLGSYFNASQISLLAQLHRLMTDQNLSASEVRHAYGHLFTGRRKKVKLAAITSGKGGVGKSTVTVNLAVAASRRGLRTMIFDADMGLGNVHVLTGVHPRGTVMDVLAGKMTMTEALVDGPENVKILCGGAGVAELANLNKDYLDFLSRELERLTLEFDLILIDTAAGIGEGVVQFLKMADEIIVVATPNVASVLDAYGVVKVARQYQCGGEIHMLMNQVDHLQHSLTVFNNISTCTQRFLGYAPQYLGYLLRDATVEQAYQSRRPFLLSYPDAPNSILFHTMARKLFFGEDSQRKKRHKKGGELSHASPSPAVQERVGEDQC